MSMGSAAGLVVEFVGLPGAGKSALSHQVAVLLRAEGLIVSEPTYRLDRVGTASRIFAKVGYGIGGAIAAPLTAARWMRTFLAMRQRSLTDTCRVALNWFFLSGLTRRLARCPGVHLMDQGIFQGLWSAGYAARDGVPRGDEIVTAVLKVLPPRVLVIVVETSPATLQLRLQARRDGNSRLERDLTTATSAGWLAGALAAFSSLQGVLELLERQEAIAVMRVQGEHAGQLQITAEAVAGRITGAQWLSG